MYTHADIHALVGSRIHTHTHTHQYAEYLLDKRNKRSIGLESWRACVAVRISASVCVFRLCVHEAAFLACVFGAFLHFSHLRFCFYFLLLFIHMYIPNLSNKATLQITLIVTV